MPLNISEHSRVGEIYGNMFANMGEQYAKYKEKQQEAKKDQASTKGAFELFAPMLGGDKYNTPEKLKARMTLPSNQSADEFYAGMKGEIQAGVMQSAYAKAAADIQESQARAAALQAQAAPKPMPGSQGYEQRTLPDGRTITIDLANGQPVSNADMQKPEKQEEAPADYNTYDEAVASARKNDPNSTVVTEQVGKKWRVKTATGNPAPQGKEKLPDDWQANVKELKDEKGKVIGHYTMVNGQPRFLNQGQSGSGITLNYSGPAPVQQ